jgi:uncharacterized membrane protein YpjA
MRAWVFQALLHEGEGELIHHQLNWLQKVLFERWFLVSLFVMNFLGTIYGYYWYKNQLAVTPKELLIFVPDSPTASLFFTLVLLFWLFSRHQPLLEALAAITLFKYGVWAVTMILLGGLTSPLPFVQALHWEHYMLITSHLGMALQAVLYIKHYRFRLQHLFIAASWTLLNDLLDYTLDIHPWVQPHLEPMHAIIATFTVLLSLVSISLFIFTRQFQHAE